MKRFAILGALLATACATSPEPHDPQVGRVLTYLRSNIDGSEAETVHVYRAARDRIEVIKTRAPCTNAAFVVAVIDPHTGDARVLEGGRLLPGATHEAFAWLTVDGSRLNMRMGSISAPPERFIEIGSSPWHLYDFDLATLIESPPPEAAAGRDFSFGVALVLVQDDALDLSWTGSAEARFTGTGREQGYAVNRFTTTGSAFQGAAGGELMLDRNDGKIVVARFGRPNHSEYRDFQLVLQQERHGAAVWRGIQLEHFEGCPGAEAGEGQAGP